MLFDLRIVQSFLWLGGPSGKESALRMQEIQEMRVQSLDHEDPLEKAMATLSSILAWKIPWRAEFGRLQPMGSQRDRHD